MGLQTVSILHLEVSDSTEETLHNSLNSKILGIKLNVTWLSVNIFVGASTQQWRTLSHPTDAHFFNSIQVWTFDLQCLVLDFIFAPKNMRFCQQPLMLICINFTMGPVMYKMSLGNCMSFYWCCPALFRHLLICHWQLLLSLLCGNKKQGFTP